MQTYPLYPLRFEPIYQYRLWGGRRLADLLSAPLPEGPIGEAWLLSDRDDHPSVVADGPLKGKTIAQLLAQAPEPLLGKLAGHFRRFPLLLKFLDVRDALSVQVHPSDGQAKYLPPGETGKTEAWVVLEAGLRSQIYAGLTPGSTKDTLRRALGVGTTAKHLAHFTPKPGDAVLIPAGTVHSLVDVVVFEVQENSDVTFRLHDWDHVDPKTGCPRALQIEAAMACLDFEQGAVGPVAPILVSEAPMLRERLLHCPHFGVTLLAGEMPFLVGAKGIPLVFVCLAGSGHFEHNGSKYPFARGDVLLLPVMIGPCTCRPLSPMRMLEITLPEVA